MADTILKIHIMEKNLLAKVHYPFMVKMSIFFYVSTIQNLMICEDHI